MSAVFLVYDYCVERRQRVVMKSSTRAGNIVSSLFPADVRDRLYDEHNNADRDVPILNGENVCYAKPGGNGKSEMIAKLYGNTSVLFADIAGFTQWSSCRTPTQVFELLETIFGAFDQVAAQRNVFKIETIGDCYVATTGLPNEQSDHAVIMVRFADDCLRKLNELLHGEVIDRLGHDTAGLAMRVGIHSGPTTVGVLRGVKSRFQIFGDTVNTAARMESTGQPGEIHLSDTTAKLLQAAGKTAWLTPRETPVEAKGKGILQTFWASPMKSSTTKSASCSCAPTEIAGDASGTN